MSESGAGPESSHATGKPDASPEADKTASVESPDGSTPDAREGTEHDCDRILYSDELRRLGGVTQVVAVGEMPLFHTRLTHTLKVQQLSRRMAEHLNRDPKNEGLLKRGGPIDPSAAEAAGLAHDLGHPPFGHVGEAALNRRARDAGLDGFEGNAQTFRILTKLSRRGEDTEFGLDLTDRTLLAVIKYPWVKATAPEDAGEKWNAYPTEKEIFDRVRDGLAPQARSAEAMIMDWADDITYAIHDLEDFIRAGRVPIVHLAKNLVERTDFTSRAVKRLATKYPELDWETVVTNFTDLLAAEFAQFGNHGGTSADLARLRSVSRRLINTYVSAIELHEGDQPIHVDPLVRGEVELFKQLTWHYVIHDPALATLQTGHARVLDDLFHILAKWLKQAEKKDEAFRLPKRLRDLDMLTRQEPGHDAYHTERSRRARAVVDYIASLTETQALDLHERLTGAGGHSVLDPWMAY